MTNDNINSEVENEVNQPIADKTIGDLIKRKREEKNLSLKVISQQTKIHIGLLESLENNDLEKLPSKTYVRGFIKSTAKILGINQKEALELLESSYASKAIVREEKIYHAPPPENSLSNNFNEISKISLENIKSVGISYITTGLKFGSIFVLIIVLGINLKNYVKNNGDESKLKLPTVLSTAHQKVKPPPKPVVAKVENKIDEANITPIKVNLIQDNKKENPEKTEIVVKDVKLKTVLTSEKQFTPDTNIEKDKLEEIFPKRFRVNVAKGTEAVFINAVEGDSWITYKVDDKEIKKYVLRLGRTVFMKGENVRLFIGNTKNVKVFYNNLPINVTAKSGMKNLVFPEEIKTKFMSPLFVFQKDGTVLTSDEYVKLNHTEPSKDETVPPVKKSSTN